MLPPISPGQPVGIQRERGEPGSVPCAPSSETINVLDATTLVTSGPGGAFGNTALDNGVCLNHGWASVSTLPEGARAILSTADPTHAVTFSYRFELGRVVYSTIPLDFFLADMGDYPEINTTLQNYAANVVAYGNSLRTK